MDIIKAATCYNVKLKLRRLGFPMGKLGWSWGKPPTAVQVIGISRCFVRLRASCCMPSIACSAYFVPRFRIGARTGIGLWRGDNVCCVLVGRMWKRAVRWESDTHMDSQYLCPFEVATASAKECYRTRLEIATVDVSKTWAPNEMSCIDGHYVGWHSDVLKK